MDFAVNALSTMARRPMLATDIGTMFDNAKNNIANWGGKFIMVLGVILALAGIIILIVGLINHGKKPVQWGLCIVMIVLGLVFARAGYGAVEGFGDTAVNTLEQLVQ